MGSDHEQDKRRPGREMTRRGFVTTMGASALAMAVTGVAAAQADTPSAKIVKADETARIVLRVNGRDHALLVENRWSLLYVLREELHLTGTKSGCERGECGACTVLMDGIPRYACLTLAIEAQGCEITTVEGLMQGEDLGPVQQAFLEKDAFQCGYCTSGQVMAVEGLLRKTPNPTLDEIRTGLSGNTCRCGAYPHLFEAAARAAELKAKK
jgi:xanthine dehydrogenase YagT iron-sulfur-binding subunit